jgi:hypothetical protein
VANAIVSATRQNDRAYRYGGDEFALLLFAAGRAQAEEVAGRVRRAVRDGVQHPSADGANIHVSASVGAAHWPEDGSSQAELVEAADAALYRAKRERGEPAARETSPEAESAAPSVDPQVPLAGPAGWVAAVRELVGAGTIAAAAAAMVRGVTALCGVSDAFVALSDGAGIAAPALMGSAASASDRESVPSRPAFARVAASGRCLSDDRFFDPDQGLWDRVRLTGIAGAQVAGEVGNAAAPLTVEGAVVGVLGVSYARGSVSDADCPPEVTFIADLGSTALSRLSGRSS